MVTDKWNEFNKMDAFGIDKKTIQLCFLFPTDKRTVLVFFALFQPDHVNSVRWLDFTFPSFRIIIEFRAG